MALHNLALSLHLWRPLVGPETQLFYFLPGIQHKLIRKMRAGKIAIEATLDLHQNSKEQARTALLQFLSNAYEQECRCVSIIHGKGRKMDEPPLLKNLVNHWLPEIPIVLGYCSCPAFLGGSGAVLVLLKYKPFEPEGLEALKINI
jgi:DNA-nicking Smr family endonuclease